jgi:hypothetical protein
MTRSVEPSNEDLRRILSAPPTPTDPQPMLGEGRHEHLGVEFTVEWLSPPIPNATGWYWAEDERSVSGPYNTANAAYHAAREQIEDDQVAAG